MRIMPKTTRLLLSGICIFFVLVMTGCWDDAEINGRAFVLGFGADSDNEGYKFTFQLAIPVSGESDSAGSIEYANLSVNEVTPAAAVRSLEKNLGREINFEQLSIIVIGEELSRKSFTGLTDYFFRRASVRRQSCIAICEGSVSDFFSASATDKAISIDAASTLQSYDAGKGNISMDLFSLYKKLINRDEFFLPRISAAEQEEGKADHAMKSTLNLSGASAYGSKGEYRGDLNADELELMLLTSGSGTGGALAVYDEQSHRYCCEIRQSHCSVKCSIIGNTPAFRLKLELVLVPLDAGGIDGGGYTPESLRRISRSAEQTVSARLEALAIKSRTAVGSSAFGLQDIIRQRQPGWYGRYGDQWESIYPGSEILITVNCTVAGGGITK